jgi:hypothetical protein
VLRSDKKVNYWEISWILPNNSRVLELRDSKGPIKEYLLLENNKLKITTNRGVARDKEKLQISILHPAVEEKFDGLKIYYVSLAGFENEDSFVIIKNENLLSWATNFGFKSFFDNNTLRIHGKGPITLKVSFSEKQKQKRYLFFNINSQNMQKISENFDEVYDFVESVYGFSLPYKHLSVIILSNETYNSYFDKWSEGTFSEPGMIFLRDSSEFLTTLVHETAHAFNRESLRWDKTNGAWFDEGSAKLVEFLYKVNKNIKYPELFGEEKVLKEKNKIIKIMPNFRPEDLMNYYYSREKFMESWDAKKENLEFGYAYSELLMRSFLMKKGLEKFRDVFKELKKLDKEIEKIEEKNNVLLGLLGIEFEPCNLPSLEEMKKCLKEINDYVPQMFIKHEIIQDDVEIPQPVLENFSPVLEDVFEQKDEANWLLKIFEKIKTFFLNLIDRILKLF